MTDTPDISPGYMACDTAIATASFQKEHLNLFSSSNKKLFLPRTNSPPISDQNNGVTSYNRRKSSIVSRGRSPPPPSSVETPHQQQQQQFRRMESGHELTITAKQTKTRQRKNVGAFRRAKQQSSVYDTWKGRVGVHVEYEEIELKKLISVIYTTLSTEWELIDCYDVVRLWLPVTNDVNTITNSSIPTATSTTSLVGGEGGYDTNNINSAEIHASMPEVFVFGFGAIVFWNFADEISEKSWINQHISPHTDALGSKHNIESIGTACDEMGFCYGDAFRWRRDVVQLYTKDAGEKMAVSFAFAKSANLSIYEWRLEQAVRRNAHIPEKLAEHGELHLKRKEIDGEIGRLYLLNNAINLTTNMLDTPEELWDDDRFAPEYDNSLKYLDVFKRIKLLNKRLEVLKDLNKILMDAAANQHSAALEWIVIVLILVWLAVAH